MNNRMVVNMESSTKYVILGLLYNESLTGYEIKKIIDSRMTFFWNESYGQIYPSLKRIKEEQLIEEVTDKVNKKKKNKYAITQKGRERFEEWLLSESNKDNIRIEILLKIYFASESNIDRIQIQLKKLYDQSIRMVKIYEAFEKQLRVLPADEHNHKYLLQFIKLGHELQNVCVEWSGEYLNKIETGEL